MRGRLTTAAVALAAAAALACGEARDEPVFPQMGIPINPLSLVLRVGDSAAVGFMPEPGARITVTSSDPGVAEPSSTDATALRGVVVRGKAPGTATLTVTFAGRQTVTGTVVVTVNPRPIIERTLVVTPNQARLGVGDTVRLVVSLIDAAHPQEAGVTFASLDSAVVAVDSAGLVRARRAGVATVRVATRASPTLVTAATITVVESTVGDARLVEARELAGEGEEGVRRLSFAVDTAARDSAGRLLHAVRAP